MKPSEKPVWYEVYEAFPPANEPNYGRKAPADVPVRQILYAEDKIRAWVYIFSVIFVICWSICLKISILCSKYWKKYGSPTTISLTDAKRTLPSQIFVQKYLEMEKNFTNEDELFEAVAQVLEEDRTSKIKNEKTTSNFASTFKEVISTKESGSGSNDAENNSKTISWLCHLCSPFVEMFLNNNKQVKHDVYLIIYLSILF